MAVIQNHGFETNTNNHVAWFGCTVERSTADFRSGVASLLCTSNAAFGSGIQLDNFPYFSGVTPGQQYDFTVWYREAVALMPDATWNIEWRDSGVAVIRTDTISLPRATEWTQVAGRFTAPAGTVTVSWNFQFSVTLAGPAIRFDDLILEDAVLLTAPTVNAGLDAEHIVATEFTRTATENDNGGAITSREWTIQAGPAGVGTTIGTAAALSWTPTVEGAYTLRYSATNSAGTGTDDVIVTAVPRPPALNDVTLMGLGVRYR